jgi:D-glycero-alpha-D-manno-heptose-7-phosphate kinase
MIISRTPFRISFFGGGTDYPVWYRENGGAVLATSIDKYCYLTCRYLPPFFEHRSRIVWSQIEDVREVSQIKHPAVREILTSMGIDDGLEIHHDGDLPARSGLGSSSSFVVGLLHALYALKGEMRSKMQLAQEAIHVEQELLQDNIGSQDQVSVACGGLNRIDFGGPEEFQVSSIILPQERLKLLENHLMLFYTGIARNASEIAGEQIKVTSQRSRELTEMYNMVTEGSNILAGNADICDFGRLLNESWQLKRSLTGLITTPLIDDIYEKALDSGAIGGKLLGAGGGGFMLFFAPPEQREAVKKALDSFLHVPFHFESSGSQIIYYQPDPQGEF